LVVSLNHVARVVSNAIVMRSGTATLNRRATGFVPGAFFLLTAPTNSLHHYYRTPTAYHPATETASKIMQEPCTKPDSKREMCNLVARGGERDRQGQARDAIEAKRLVVDLR
jgi:hypothetical protein